MKIIWNGIYLISMLILAFRSYRAAKVDHFQDSEYPTKLQMTIADRAWLLLFLFSFNISALLYPIRGLTFPILFVMAAFYTWIVWRNYRIYRRAKVFLSVSIFWIIVIIANVVAWNPWAA